MHFFNKIKRIQTLLVFIFTLSILQTFSRADTMPWWLQGFEVEKTEETNYEYNRDGSVKTTVTTQGDSLRFSDIQPQSQDSFTPEEQSILSSIENEYLKNPDLTYDALLDSLANAFADSTKDTVLNMIGYYEFKQHKGFYTYLDEPLSEESAAIYDVWQEIHRKKYPEAPQTFTELQRINSAILQELSDQFKKPIDEIDDILYKVEKYQEAFNLPKNVSLSKNTQQEEPQP